MKIRIAEAVEKGCIIRKLVSENPYREGTNRHKRFEAYREGKTVESVIADKRVNIDGFRGDVNRGVIAVVSKRSSKAGTQ